MVLKELFKFDIEAQNNFLKEVMHFALYIEVNSNSTKLSWHVILIPHDVVKPL